MHKSTVALAAAAALLGVLAAAAVVPSHKPDGQNELIAASDSEHDDGGGGGSDGTYQDPGLEREHRGSIAASFGPMVDAMRRYRAAGMAADMANEVAVPDTVIVGNRSDTYLTSVRVKGLRDVDGQTMIVSWKEDSVYVKNIWPKLTVNGVYNHVKSGVRHSGVFEIMLIEPEYAGTMSLTKNANIYRTMSPASWVTFKKVVINHTELPEMFQNEKLKFDNFVKNVVCQYVAIATSAGMYSNITLGIVKAAKPYLTYRSDKIADADDGGNMATATGQLNNGDRFELKNLQMDVAKDNLAKIYEVQTNQMGGQDTAAFRLRLAEMAGQCDWSVTKSEEGSAADAGKLVFEFDTVDVAVALNFGDKTAHVDVDVDGPSADLKNAAESAATVAAWTNAKDRLTDELVRFFVTTLARSVDHNVRDAM